MSAQHTPGPWAALEDDSFDGCDFIPVETDQPTGPSLRLICEVRPATGELTEVDRANANLIAAAPALFEALEMMWDTACTNASSTPSKAAFLKARAAINSAKGVA